MKRFNFYYDGGHGWLAVNKNYLELLDILQDISTYSYQNGDTVYLEEDCDYSLFVNTLKDKNIEIEVKEVNHGDHSIIRNYERVKQNAQTKIPA